MTYSLAPVPPNVDPDVWAGLCARVRDLAGWHVAPRVVEDVTVSVRGADRLVLPTLMLTKINSATSDGYAVTVSRFTEWGTVYVDSWPYSTSGDGWWSDVTLNIEHGYTTCPPALLDAMEREARSMAPAGVPSGRLQAGPFSAEYSDGLSQRLLDDIRRYALPDQP